MWIQMKLKDNTPQPLDQWTKSQFMGHQVGNCMTFTLTHYLADLFCHASWPKVNPIVLPTSYPTYIPFIPNELTFPILRYSNFNNLPWRSKVKVICEVKVQSHNMGPTSYWLKSCFCHVNPPSHSYDTDFFKISPWKIYSYLKIWPWKSKVKVMGKVNFESHNMGPTSYRHTSLSFHVNRPSRHPIFLKFFDHENHISYISFEYLKSLNKELMLWWHS